MVDSGLCELAKTRLRKSGYAPLSAISVESRYRALVLSGRVPTYFLKQMAQELALRTPGVQQIRNELQVPPVDARDC